MVKKAFLIIIFLIVANVTYADVMLGGADGINPYDGSPFHNTRWKAFRFQAPASGQADYAKLYLKDLIGDRTDDEVGAAIYDDNNGEVGNLKVWGYVRHYNWNTIGTWQFHSFNLSNVETSRNIIAGNYYWISFQTSGGENVLMERGSFESTGLPLDTRKRGSEYLAITPPPSGPSFSGIVYGNGGYAWSVWGSGGLPDTIPPVEPPNLRIPE